MRCLALCQDPPVFAGPYRNYVFGNQSVIQVVLLQGYPALTRVHDAFDSAHPELNV